MPLTPGTRLGVYDIIAPIGEGGMGAVFRARDTKLDRDVAIKILSEAFAHDADRLARFTREAKTLASLNHPNIAHIHGLEESGGMTALVMELVEGDDLSQRIERGAIPIDEALPIARQIADALEAAHDQGIVHRDLKPSNIKVRSDGTVKVLDFGLAKALAPAGAGATADVTNSPTITSPAQMTGVGMILGTAAYMSPEQAKGKTVDRRADIWAFGVVLFEMLTARRAFGGENVSETLAEVIKSEPDWGALPTNTPPSIRRLLRRCLSKDVKGRIADASMARIEIDEAGREPHVNEPVAPRPSRGPERIAWVALSIVTLMAAGLAVRAFRPVAPLPELRLDIATPPTTDPASLAISPDGERLVFVASFEGRPQLWLRSLKATSTRPIPGTVDAQLPFWSPDSRSIGFFADSRLKRVDIDGGSMRTLANSGNGGGGAWNAEGVILFNAIASGPIMRVSDSGGEPTPLTRVVAPQVSHVAPRFLPDGQHFLYYASGSPDVRGVYLGSLEGSETRLLLDADSSAEYATGHLLYVRQADLYAQQFDVAKLGLTGTPTLIAEQVAMAGRNSAVSASVAGPVVYRTGSSAGQRQLQWFDRSGREMEKVGAPGSVGAAAPSPDGRRIALNRTVNGNSDIWLLDTVRGGETRLTFDSGIDNWPVWSPDSSRIAFESYETTGTGDLFLMPAAGSRDHQLLLSTPQVKFPSDWSPDGRTLLFRSLDPKRLWDIWALSLEGDRKAFPAVQTDFDERDAQFSPDGKWIAYQSNESGRFEIYVQPFPGPGAKSSISTAGGTQVRWRRDGTELFYIALDGRLMSVPLRLGVNSQAAELGAPVPLFLTHVGGVQGIGAQQYAVSANGQRFLMNTVAEEAASPITVMLNWQPTSKK